MRTRAGAERAAKVRAFGRGPLAFEAHMSAFVAELRAHHYSKALQEHGQRVLPRLFVHLRENSVRDVRGATEAHLVSFARVLAAMRTKRGNLFTLQTQNAYLSIVRHFFAYLERSNAILRNPALEVPLHRLHVLPRHVLSEKDAEALMEAPPALDPVGLRDRAILETLYGTAIRLSECASIDLEDLDLAGEALLIRNGKGGKDRVVPVPVRAAAALGVYLKDVRPLLVRDPKEQALFLRRWGARISTCTIGALVRSYGEAIGVKLTPHGLRHACATHLLNHGADVRHVQRLLGHRDIQTTARYTGVSIEDLRAVLEKAHPRERQSERRRKGPGT